MSQLERLARPFPSKYVRAPAAGKFGEYVPHHIVTQALLAIVGPFDLQVGEVFCGAEGRIEGCLVTLVAEVDGRRVSVTEVGDCEQPTNWKTQGARLKDCISDGVKRCAARLGCGLHLYSGAEFFLYEQLRDENAEGAGRGGSPTAESADTAFTHAPSPSATSPVVDRLREQGHPKHPSPEDGPATSAGVGPSSEEAGHQSPAPASSFKSKRMKLKSRCVQLGTGMKASISEERARWNLPIIDECDEKQLGLFSEMLDEIERELEKPFEKADA